MVDGLARLESLVQVADLVLDRHDAGSARLHFVDAHDVQTIYFETLVSPAIAKTVASETGAKTAVLDPLEGLNDDSEGNDYLEVMRANLANIEAGQPCR